MLPTSRFVSVFWTQTLNLGFGCTRPEEIQSSRREVLERHCLQSHEMDWGAFSESWRTALDIKPGLFLQLAGLGVDTLRLFLCLPPARAIELGLTYLLTSGRGTTPQAKLASSVTDNLVKDLECVGPLLTALSQSGTAGASELSPRMAAMKWLLLTVISPSQSDGNAPDLGFCRITEHALEQLVQSNVMLCPRGRSDLLIRVASMLICFDGDVLNSQHEIKRFLLETDMALAALLPSSSATVGRAVVSLLFCPDHAEQIKQGELGASLARSFEDLLGYNVLDWTPMDAHGEPHRLTAAAHAAILEHAPDLESIRAIVTKPLLAAMSKLMVLQSAPVSDHFLCDVLENLPTGSDTLTLTILKILSGEDEPVKSVVDALSSSLRSVGSNLLASSKNPFLPALFSALQSRSLGNYLSMVASHKSVDPGRPLLLALDSSPVMVDLYIQYFRTVISSSEIGSASLESALGIHNSMLDDASCAALFSKLAAAEPREAHQSDLVLMWYCWARSPDKQLPFWALPSFKSGPLCIASLDGSGISFVERCKPMRFGLSVLAKFLVAPETLPLGVYNTLAEKASWVHAEEQSSSAIKVQTLLLGQEDQEEYPPYCIRWHARALPSSLKKQLLRQCNNSVAPLLDTSLHDFYPRVNSGMGEANLRFNLGLLLALRFGNPDLQVYFDHGADIQRQFLAGCILCWCKAAGFSFTELLSCVKAENQDDFKTLWHEIHDAYSRTGPASLRRMYVRGPLPTDIDVRWIDDGGRDVPILARTRDSAVLTAQWCNMLLLHFKLTRPEPFTPQDFVVSEGNLQGLQAGPRLQGALASISEAVGSALRAELLADLAEPSLVVPLGEGKYDTLRLVTRISVLADFVFLLRASTVGVETSAKIGQFFASIVGSLAAGDTLADTELAARDRF